MKTWWRAVVSYPPSWIAIAAVIAAVVAILVILEPPALLAGIVIGVGVAAIILWPLTLSATGTLRQLQFSAPELSDMSETEKMLLGTELERLDDPRPLHQLQAIGEKRDNLIAVLDQRLQPGELTYSRYQTTAQQVYLAVITNLREVAVALRSISTINPAYIEGRLGELSGQTGESTEQEASSLTDRQSLAVTQESKVAYLLAQNESAMTLLDRTATALADAPIGLTPQDAEAAMSALEELADRAGRYAAA